MQKPTRHFMSLVRSLPPSQSRRLRRNLLFISITLGLITLLTVISKAHAAGGAYVVDDAAINAPGECNIDAWYQSGRHNHSSSNAVLSQDCTLKGLPNLQLGAAIQHSRDDGDSETQLSPQFKTLLFSREDLGIQLALAGSAHFTFNRDHTFDGADLNLPFTYQPIEALRLNVNAGWAHAYDDGEQNHRWTWGTGVEYDLARSLTLVAERYGQQGGEQAWQAGPRLHIGERVDVDLLVGRDLTGERDQWLTTGATVRF
ncbi:MULTISPECIES: hypothetical protein [Pseudomonas]|uniref:Uncharacterized protein n=1 Tax=Pseudomonas fluorescens TaxID=294 RepID=A0A166PX24_PSEFL|nr:MULTISPECIES: hypothetical protein [Pseudomonas]KZN19433.1 hypothetical protein A1D17_25965 [Pseudomonas fluorescens]